MILYVGDFMNFQDYLTFIRALWPECDEDGSIRKKLWRKSTHRLPTKFINGEDLEIEYNYDHTRMDYQRCLINAKTLLPVLGIMELPFPETFVDINRLTAFVSASVYLNQCHDYENTSCLCHLSVDYMVAANYKPPREIECAEGHFHHFCSHHVNYWLKHDLEVTIKELEGEEEKTPNRWRDWFRKPRYFRNGEPVFLHPPF